MQDQRHRETDNRALRRWTGRGLIAAGLAMLAWCGYFLADGYFAQQGAHAALESFARSEHGATVVTGTGEAATVANVTPPTALVRGAAVAELAIPRVKLSAVVLHGSDTRTLRRGPGHLENTPLPGETGNVVIAGHRDTFFRALRNIRIGDEIYTETPAGRFRYRVVSTRVVKPRDLTVLAPTGEAVLTLITCYPFWVLGDAPDRFVVRAEGVGEPNATAFVPSPARPHELVPVPAPPRTRAATSDPPDDDTTVRWTVERFRVAFNARLASHPQASTRPLAFETCTVSIDGDTASAVCAGKPSRDLDDADPRGRSFELERIAQEWAIRSVVAR